MESVLYWNGRPVSEMSNDELVEVIRELAEENRALRNRETAKSVEHINHVADMVRDFNQRRRGSDDKWLV